MTTATTTTAVFRQPFELPGFDETLPAGEYEVDTVPPEPVNGIEPGNWTPTVLIHLHPRVSYPGLSRTLTVPLSELERAVAQDKRTGKALTDSLIEEMLADPMVRLFMRADAVSEAEMRELNSGRGHARSNRDEENRLVDSNAPTTIGDGMAPHWGSPRPGIGE